MHLAMAARVALLSAGRDRLGAAGEGAAEVAGADVGEEPPQPATVARTPAPRLRANNTDPAKRPKRQ
jgi:hypothetical protein